MANVVATRPENLPDRPETVVRVRGREWTRYLVPLGRLLFAGIFILSTPELLSPGAIVAARIAGVPAPQVLVPIAGIFAFLGAMSVLLGFHARVGAWLLVVFLVPVTLSMHRFWAAPTPVMATMQLEHFLKNTSMLGAALMIAHFGAGPLSFDARKRT